MDLVQIQILLHYFRRVNLNTLYCLPWEGLEGLQARALLGVLCCVLEQDTLSSAYKKTHSDMTEKLLTGM